MSERQVIAGAAQRLAAFCDAITDAQLVHGVSPGAIDDLSDGRFQQAAKPVYDLTLSPAYEVHIGAVFGWVAMIMERIGDDHADVAARRSWQMAADYYRHTAASLSPQWRSADIDVTDLVAAAATRSPAVMRFDLLAGLVTVEAAQHLADAARACITIVSSGAIRDRRLDALTLEEYLRPAGDATALVD